MSSNIGKPIPDSELLTLDRDVLIWLNRWPDKPVKAIVTRVTAKDSPCMFLFPISGTYRTDMDILGGYEVEYLFQVVYRVAANSDDKSLLADETLNKFGQWLEQHPPDFSPNAEVLGVLMTKRSELSIPYEDNDEDHTIYMRLTYRVAGDEF